MAVLAGGGGDWLYLNRQSYSSRGLCSPHGRSSYLSGQSLYSLPVRDKVRIISIMLALTESNSIKGYDSARLSNCESRIAELGVAS